MADAPIKRTSQFRLIATPKIIRVALALILMVGGVSSAHALEVYWAGLAYLGPYDAIAKNFPYSEKLFPVATGKPSQLDEVLLSRLREVANPSFTIVTDRLGTLGPDSPSAISLAFALDHETVSVEKIGGRYKILVELSGQALFFDFHEKAVVASAPVVLPFIDSKDSLPGDAQLGEIVRTQYLGGGDDVVARFLAAVSSVSLNREVQRRIGVTDVSFDAEALAQIPGLLRSSDANPKMMLAQAFGKYLVQNQRVPVLPYAADYAIGNRMAGRFANGTVFNLSLPQPDYAIELRLTKLEKKLWATRKRVSTTFFYLTYLHVKVFEPLSGKSYFDATVANSGNKVVPADQLETDDWPAFQETVEQLLDQFTEQIDKQDAAWVQIHTGKPAVIADLRKLQKVLQTCK